MNDQLSAFYAASALRYLARKRPSFFAFFIDYLRIVLLHKYLVYREGRTLGLARRRLLIHDYTKFYPREYLPYAIDYALARSRTPKPAWVVRAHRAAKTGHQH